MAGKQYWAAGYHYGKTESQLSDFIEKKYWSGSGGGEKFINEIKIGDIIILKSLGGQYDLKIKAIGEVNTVPDKNSEKGDSLKIGVTWKKKGNLYSGKAPSRKDYPEGGNIGNWFNTLVKVENESVQKKFFDDLLEAETNSITYNYLDYFKLTTFYNLKDIHLENLKDKRQIYFLAENGDGKTLLLKALMLHLKKDDIEKDDKVSIREYLEVLEIEKLNTIINIPILAYGSSRVHLETMKKHSFYETLFSDYFCLKSPTEILFKIKIKEMIKDYSQKSIIEDSIDLFKNLISDFIGKIIEIGVADESITFKKIYNEDDDLPFEKLSSGYRNLIVWLFDMIYTLFDLQSSAEIIKNEKDEFAGYNFRAIVLIDEIEVHMHPKWETALPQKLAKWFPNVQFFITTHSPEIILGASTLGNVDIYKLKKEEENGKFFTTIVNLRPEDPDNPGERISIKNFRIDQILSGELFDTDSRIISEETRKLIIQKKELLLKPELSEEEEVLLDELEKKIGRIPINEYYS